MSGPWLWFGRVTGGRADGFRIAGTGETPKREHQEEERMYSCSVWYSVLQGSRKYGVNSFLRVYFSDFECLDQEREIVS